MAPNLRIVSATLPVSCRHCGRRLFVTPLVSTAQLEAVDEHLLLAHAIEIGEIDGTRRMGLLRHLVIDGRPVLP